MIEHDSFMVLFSATTVSSRQQHLFSAVKGSLCVSLSAAVFLGGAESTPGAGQRPATAAHHGAAPPSARFTEGDRELGVSRMKTPRCRPVGFNFFIFTIIIIIVFVANSFPYAPQKFKRTFERDSWSQGDTPSSLLSREFLGQVLRKTSTPESCLEAASKCRPSSRLTQVISKRLFLLLVPVF